MDLELLGWSQATTQIMLPIWSDYHGDRSSGINVLIVIFLPDLFVAEPIALANAPEGWPSESDGPTITFSSGFEGVPNDRSGISK